MSECRLVAVGGGNMGEAVLRGVLAARLLAPAEVAVVEPVEARRATLSEQLGVRCVAAIHQAPPAEAYLLAVKPQQMAVVLPGLAGALGAEGALVVSIAAGVSTRRLAEGLGPKARVIRTMPNTPMLAGVGCTGLAAGPGATEADLVFAESLFAASGQVHRLAEGDLDALTAVSGSGPAYFLYLIEAMVAAGVAEGLEPAVALALARQTCAGAAALLANTAEAPEVLRRKVTSPGGTTQAAIETLDAAGVQESVVRAVRAAAARSRELGR